MKNDNEHVGYFAARKRLLFCDECYKKQTDEYRDYYYAKPITVGELRRDSAEAKKVWGEPIYTYSCIK